MANPSVGKHDPRIHAALKAGWFQVDPATGRVTDLAGRYVDEHLNQGYRVIYLGAGVQVRAHRLVWIACEGPIPAGMEINHRNRIRDDNRICNLEVTSHAENMAHALETPYYERIRDEDLEAVDPAWLSRVIELAESGRVTPEQVAALRPEPRTPVGTPEYRQWLSDNHVDRALSGQR